MTDFEWPRPTDAELLARLPTGERDALEEIYHRYVGPVFGLAARRLDDPKRAERAVREVFASVATAAPSYRSERKSAARWLFDLAWNIVEGFAPREDAPNTLAEGVIPTRKARREAAWVAWRVYRALNELPAGERKALAVAYWSPPLGRGAASADVPLDPVKTRSALGRLAALLESEELA